MFQWDDSRDFWWVQSLTMGEAVFKQFMWLRNQLVIAVGKFGREWKLSPMLIPTMSKKIDGQLKLSHGVADVVDRTNTKKCVTLLRYSVENPEISYAQFRFVQGIRRTSSINQLSMWILHLKNLSICLLKWIDSVIKFPLINPFVRSH